jgi:CheY-specific phosphatase CheX
MFSQYFGNYLLSNGIISLEQLKDVMDIQKSIHIKVGILAVNSGYMTAAHVEEIHHLQTKMDKRFGEIAIEMGYITQDILEKILSEQKNAYLMLGQALMDRDYMTLSEVERALIAYKRDYSLSDIQLNAIQNGDVEEIVDTFVKLNHLKNKEIYKEYISLLVRNLIRFIDGDIRIEGFSVKDSYTSKYMVIQNILGEHNNLWTGMEANEETFLKFASIYAEEDITMMDDLAIESFGEFLNLQNGIFTVNKSNHGIEMELTPQKLIKFTETPDLNDAVGVTFYLPFGEINMIISEIL